MTDERYNFVPREYWPRLGPAFQGIDVNLGSIQNDMAALGAQTTTGQIDPARLGTGTRDGSRFLADDGTWKTPPTGDGGGVITSGPYTLDPKRAPADTVVALPAGTTVLTHIGNRFTGGTPGTTPTGMTLALSGTITLSNPNTGTRVYASGGLFGTRVDYTTSTNPSDVMFTSVAPFPAGQKEIVADVVMTVPEPTADCAVFTLYRTSGMDVSVLIKPGTSTGKTQFVVNDSKTTGSWNYVSPDFPSGSMVRFAMGGMIGDGSTGAQRASAYIVNADGTETQIGTTYSVSAAPTPASDVYSGIQFGKLSAQASIEGKTIQLHSIRVAYGAGAYAAGPLKDERLYPAAV